MRDRRTDLPRKSSPAAKSAARPAATGGTPPAEPQDAEPVRKKKILVVDDSFTSLERQQLALAESSYDIVVARDGREAIAKAVVEQPDLILMDVVMPRLDGFVACRLLRKFKATKDVPIIIMTSRNDETSRKIGEANGCTEYLTKPLSEEELLAKIRAYLGD